MTNQNTVLVFVRHGESEKNILKLRSYSVDKWPLTKKGQEHAQNVAGRLLEMGKFDLIISSPVLRARQTAEIIAAKLQVPVECDDLLSEYNCGTWNDNTIKQLEDSHSDYQEYMKIIRGTDEHFRYKLGGAESRADIVTRLRQFLNKVLKQHPGRQILLVSHGGINAAIAKVLHGISTAEFYEKELIDHETVEFFEIPPGRTEI